MSVDGIQVATREVKVTRVEVQLSEYLDKDYHRVEVVFGFAGGDRQEFEMSGPDAQLLGAMLNRAGGGSG